MALSDLSVYVHLPICPSRCDYCDFYSETVTPDAAPRLQSGLVDRLLAEATAWFQGPAPEGLDLGDARVATIYIGGGSPTFLGADQLERLLSGLRRRLPIGPEVEWTLESHPQELSPEILHLAHSAGVNRLSLGIQSFHAEGLRLIGRRHPGSVSLKDLTFLLAGRQSSLSVDVIGEMPGQTPERLAGDLESALELGAEHVSVYPLSWPGDSPRGPDPRGRLGYPDFDAWEVAEGVLLPEGFHRYEVSSFARPGAECRHSLAYWRLDPYLGIGPGGVGTIPLEAHQRRSDRWTLRTTGISPISAYLAAPNLPAVSVEAQSKRVAFFERLMMGFRLTEGLDPGGLREEFGEELVELLQDSLSDYVDSHIDADDRRLRCTSVGRRNLDAMLRDLTKIMD